VRLPFRDSPEFRRLLDGDPGADLTRVALEIARDAYPEVAPEPYLEKIEALALRVRERCPADSRPRQVLGHINWVLFVEEGFHGNTEAYQDPRNSYLNEVIDRKTGIPISLSVLYKALADRLGLPMAGVNLPAHFVLRTGQGESTLFVDPFHSGVLLDRRGCEQRISELTGQAATLTDAQLAPCPSRLVVARMLRNLKAVYLHENDFASALPVLRRLVAVSDDDPIERRELGIVCHHSGHSAESIEHLRAYLDSHPNSSDSEAIRSLLRSARHDAAMRN
jgi:regulator of sirC expression with transglutaminase-like and TPR domain